MSPDEFAKSIVKRYGEPYTTNARCLSYLHKRCNEAAIVYEQWGCDVRAMDLPMRLVFNEVVAANTNLLLDAGLEVPDAASHKLMSPVLDFRSPDCFTEDNEVLQYHAQLEKIVWDKLKGYGNADQSGVDIVIDLPIYYDVWLQIVTGWDNPETIVKEQLEDGIV